MTGWVGLIVIETRDDIGSVHVYVCMDCDFRKLVNYCYRLYTRPHHPASFKHHPASFKHHHASFKNHHASFKSGQVSGIMSSATMSLLLLMLLGYHAATVVSRCLSRRQYCYSDHYTAVRASTRALAATCRDGSTHCSG